ncbi:cell division protein FtsQ/DivIB [Flavobacterium sp. '19STA2R22 D10 B1']|uniref:cell division protein FtsQ/DivIB n=1 Tax=Flavobacterium aerium TaxID=3037261 RepID=UPI00278C72A1|nr:cell division protein FtsQ [Flavobacterium sp. '19STA2R22 D10 B1']
MKRFNWINVKLIVMFALVIFLYSFTSRRNEQRKVLPPVVEFLDGDNLFVTREAVNKLLIQNSDSPLSIAKDKLDLNKLEHTLESQDMIQHAEVFIGIDGALKAVVKQKTPVARVFEGGDSFYVDYEGGRMPLSEYYTARVPLVSGEINEKNNVGLNKLFKFIYEDEFLQKNIIGIQVLPNGGVKMMNRNYNYEIDFGKTVNIERKFDNYKAFFQKAVQDSSINNYKKVNLKFTQQVVCTKN